MGSSNGLMGRSMRDIGQKIRPMERASSLTFMVMFMMVNGKMTKPMGSAPIPMPKLMPSMKDTGKTICSMDRASKCMQMAIDMKECLNRAKDMGKESTFLPMAPSTTANG